MSPAKRPLRVCISTHNPAEEGGVLAVTRALVQILSERECELRLLWPSHSLGRAAWRDADRQFPGLDCIELPSVPQLETLRYTIPALFGRRFADGADIFQSIGGPSLTAVPLALWRKRFVCWIGTTLADERQAQMLSADWSRGSWYLRGNQPFFFHRPSPGGPRVPFGKLCLGPKHSHGTPSPGGVRG